MTRAQWLALAERCQKATGPDREIDVEIGLAIDIHPLGLEKLRDIVHLWGSPAAFAADCQQKNGNNAWGRMLPRYTASLDAIAGLIERVLPGWRVRWHTDGDGVHEAFLENKGDFGAIEARHTLSFATTPALALCAAFCAAMAERCEA